MTTAVTLNVSGLTPALLGTGLDFDVELTAIQPENPIKFAGAINGQVNLDVPSLLSDESGTLEIIEQAQMNINGLTPDVLGTGLEFDVEFAPAQPQNPIPLTGEINGQVNIDAAALEGDEDGTMQIIPVAEVTVVGLTPEALGSGLPWDAMRQTDGYLTPAAREAGDPEERVIEVAWEPNENPAPFDAPVVRPNVPEQPVVGTMPMLSEPLLGEPMLFTLNAAGSEEGTEDSTRTVRGSWQPLTVKEQEEYATITKGSQAFWLYCDPSADLRDAQSETPDRVPFDGQDYEVAKIEPWGNLIPHLRALCVSLKPFVEGSP